MRVAVIGAGRWGPNLVRNFQSLEGAEVVTVVDREESRLTALREKVPGVSTSTDLSDALADGIDGVVIATPTVTHFDLVKEALQADKHVMVEKPITKTSSEGRILTDLAADHGRVLMVGHVFLYNPAIRHIRSMLDDGELGEICYLSMHRTNLGPVRMDVNASWDLASHDISIANWWLGERPEAVSATGHDWINRGVADSVFVTIRYPGKVRCHIHASWLHPKKARDVALIGTKQMLIFDDLNQESPVQLFDKRVTEDKTVPGFVEGAYRIQLHDGGAVAPAIEPGEPLKAECEEFVRCVAEGVAPESDGQFASDVVACLEAIDRSMANGGAEIPIDYGAVS